MNQPARFDLDHALNEWRASLATSSALGREDLDELEGHLRDSIVALEGKGLSCEEAFLIATKRLGKRRYLTVEYAKINANRVWSDRVLWMLIGIQAWTLASAVNGAIAKSAVFLAWRNQPFPGSAREVSMVSFAAPTLFTATIYFACLAGIVWAGTWLIKAHPQTLSRLNRRWLPQRAGYVAVCFVFCLFGLLVYELSSFTSLIMARFGSLDNVAHSSVAMTYARFFLIGPLQIIAFGVIITALMRKRLRLTSG